MRDFIERTAGVMAVPAIARESSPGRLSRGSLDAEQAQAPVTRVLPLMVDSATEDRLRLAPVIAAPAMTIDGQHDPFTPAGDWAAYSGKFAGDIEHQVLAAGHKPAACRTARARTPSRQRH